MSTYHDIMEISDRIKKVEPRKDFSTDKKDVTTAVSNLKMRVEVSFSEGTSPGGFRKPRSPTPKAEDLKDFECLRCQLMSRAKALDDKGSMNGEVCSSTSDSLLLTNLGQFRIQSGNEGHLVRIFVDTGANGNTITRNFIVLYWIMS